MRYLKDPIGNLYGVVPNRGIIESILLMIPLIRNLYARKVQLCVTAIDKRGPIIGTFRFIWVFRMQKLVSFRFRIPVHSFPSAYMFIRDSNDNEICHDELPKSDYKPWEEYKGLLRMR